MRWRLKNLAYVSTQPSILEILSKRGRTSLADNLKYNLEITNDQYAEIKKVWQKQKGFKELIKEMEERSEPFDAEPLPEQEGEGGGEIVEKANKTPAKASPKKKDSKKLKGDPKSKASEDDQEVLLPGAKRLKKTPAEELHAEVVPSDIIEVPATEEPEAVLREEAPAAPAFQVTGNASSAFAGIGTILNKQPEVYSFLGFQWDSSKRHLDWGLGNWIRWKVAALQRYSSGTSGPQLCSPGRQSYPS